MTDLYAGLPASAAAEAQLASSGVRGATLDVAHAVVQELVEEGLQHVGASVGRAAAVVDEQLGRKVGRLQASTSDCPPPSYCPP